MLSRVFLVSMKVKNNFWFLFLVSCFACNTLKKARQSQVALVQVQRTDSAQQQKVTTLQNTLQEQGMQEESEDRAVLEYVFSEPATMGELKSGAAKVQQLRVIESKKRAVKKHKKLHKQDKKTAHKTSTVSAFRQRDSLNSQVEQSLKRSASSAFWFWFVLGLAVVLVLVFGLFRFGRSFF